MVEIFSDVLWLQGLVVHVMEPSPWICKHNTSCNTSILVKIYMVHMIIPYNMFTVETEPNNQNLASFSS